MGGRGDWIGGGSWRQSTWGFQRGETRERGREAWRDVGAITERVSGEKTDTRSTGQGEVRGRGPEGRRKFCQFWHGSYYLGTYVRMVRGGSARHDFSPEYERLQPGRGGPDERTGTQSRCIPSVITALQNQIGLKLESRKGPVEFIVVDPAEKPSAN